MLPLSYLTFTFGKSKDFVKLAGVLHAFGAYVLFQSSLPFVIITGMTIVLLISIGRIARHPVPVPAFASISHHNDHWQLLGSLGQIHRYAHVCIRFDAGLFILLRLSNADACQTLVVFRDQLTTVQYRALNVLGAIRPKKDKMNEKD